MLYWTLIVFSFFLCSCFLSIIKDYKDKKRILFVYIIILVYFSSFRFGLGQDYEGYLNRIDWENYLSVISWINEPLISILSIVIEKTQFTPLLFFAFFSSITIPCLFTYFSHKDNSYLLSTIALFTLLPTLYFNTFNLVRQFTAAGLFFFSIQYIEKKKFLPYLLCMLVAASIHLSALFLIPLFFIINKQYHTSTIVIVLVGLFIVFSVAYPFIEKLSFFSDRYSIYLDTEEQMGMSRMILLYNIMGIAMLFIKKKFTNSFDHISYNLFFLFILFSDLSFVNFYFFRLAVYFSPVFAYMFPKLIGEFFGKQYAYAVSVIFSLFFFIPFLINNIDNPTVVPSEILPFSALWDASKYQIVYSINP